MGLARASRSPKAADLEMKAVLMIIFQRELRPERLSES